MAAKSPADIRKLNKTQLLDYALEITENFNAIAEKCEDFSKRIAALENSIPATAPAKFLQRLESAERENTNNGQYLRRRQVEMWNLPVEVTDANDLKKEAAAILSLTGVTVAPNDIDIAHKLPKQGKIILEFRHRDQRDKIIRARKNLKTKKNELTTMKCPRLSVVESMCPAFRRLDFICRQLKTREKIGNTWFFNRKLLIVDNDGIKSSITHINDLITKFGDDIVQAILN